MTPLNAPEPTPIQEAIGSDSDDDTEIPMEEGTTLHTEEEQDGEKYDGGEIPTEGTELLDDDDVPAEK